MGFFRGEIRHKESKNEQHAKRRIRHRIPKNQYREGVGLDPYPARKRMLLHDVPQKVKEEGKEITAIPAMLDNPVIEITQQWKRDIREKDTRNGTMFKS